MRHLLISAALLTVPTLASAQDSIFDIPEEEQLTFADLGIAAVTRETYVGSEESDLSVLPYINAQYKGRFFANPALGAGAYAIRNETFRLGGSVHYSLGRDGEDTPLLDEAFDIDGGFAGLISSRLYTPIAAIDVVANVPLSGDLDGYRIDTLVTTQFFPIENLRINPGVRATYHSGDYLDSLYGINDAQLAATTLPAGSPVTTLDFGSEVSTLGAHMAAYLDINDDFQLIGIVNYSRLVGDVEDTTLAPKKDGITAALGLARTF
ncbi:MipA/OmpV family protein [Litorimonas sp. WD9-15]|uniref:MipA/OmpV family protein n=1 Tax=Litorimonas sp. WD9-15 TaxID=3418716 RepID=UPI003D04065D